MCLCSRGATILIFNCIQHYILFVLSFAQFYQIIKWTASEKRKKKKKEERKKKKKTYHQCTFSSISVYFTHKNCWIYFQKKTIFVHFFSSSFLLIIIIIFRVAIHPLDRHMPFFFFSRSCCTDRVKERKKNSFIEKTKRTPQNSIESPFLYSNKIFLFLLFASFYHSVNNNHYSWNSFYNPRELHFCRIHTFVCVYVYIRVSLHVIIKLTICFILGGSLCGTVPHSMDDIMNRSVYIWS